MRLDADDDAATPVLRDAGDCAREALDRRLLSSGKRPLVVAFSGGGDSLALLLIAQGWARRAGREVVAVTVDHGLNPQSPAWTAACAATAARLDVGFERLAWLGPKPATGLPAAARAARHRLIAEAARGLGGRIILMGHTADDVLEARAMRAAGATTPEPRDWSPSPVWPQGRGLFVLRPLLGLRREDLRRWLRMRGESWIEDPANADPRYARVRARAVTSGAPGRVTPDEPAVLGLGETITEDAGVLSLSRQAFRDAPGGEADRVLAIACVCAGGGERRPAGARVARLAAQIRGGETVAATLAGARVEADPMTIRISREPGEARRGGLAQVALPVGEPVVWDGRYRLKASRAGLVVRRLAGCAARLPSDQRQALNAVPARARGALPAIIDAEGTVSCPVLAPMLGVKVKSLVARRLRAACGLVARELA